jgi:hypothetical protein
MVLGIFIGGMFLGFSLGCALMALLAAGSLSSKPKGHQQLGVIFPGPTLPPEIVNPRWGLGHRPPGLSFPLGLERGGGTRTWQ